ncbi:potassium/sodium hyperpolarization-activated cyclic nucleotide-gated channel 1-like [Athalia rosae]|uniref:potassium/sodium hyperpolarization-activated cyclic nucleotide-gated channel 1-like n=1 Tax=Athalia rosae TaxID=37344 RepID=UPI002033ABFE|nr:potassium/sodium hyperpolarization-activated cyclic nucleotide-gated channel 1-like [Athalia rosae]
MKPRHSCVLSSRDFEAIPRASVRHCKYFVRKWKQWTTISTRNHRTKFYVPSSAGLTDEKRRHMRMKWSGIIHPFSQMRMVWDTLMVIVYCVSFITIPLMTSFKILNFFEIQMDDFNLYVYAFCWADIFMNCVSGVYDEATGRIVLELREIIRIYMEGFFFIDVVSSIPYDRLTLPWRVLPGPNSGLIIPTINLVMPNLKLLRFITVSAYSSQIFKVRFHFNVQHMVSQAFNTVIFALFMLHWFACLCYALPTLVMNLNQHTIENCQCWISQLGTKEPSMHTLYRHSLFMAVINLTGSSYGIIPPVRLGHMMVCTILMLAGSIFINYIIVMILQMRSQKYITETKYEEIMNQLHAYMRQKQLPEYMKRRLLAYYYYRFLKSFYREKEISSTLTDDLRRDIALHSSRRFIQNVSLFRDLPRSVLESIVVNLRMELYLPNDVIVKAGTQGDCMFFLASGTVAVLTPTGKEVCHLEDGAHFGEVALLVQDQRRVASVVAIEVCNVFRLERKDFRRCIAVHTDLFAKIERLATGRMEKTVLLEEQHKRFLLQRSSRRPSTGIRNLRTMSLYVTPKPESKK